MTRDKAEYIKNWLFRANEDIAVIKSLVNDVTLAASVFMLSKHRKSSLRHSWLIMM